MPPLDYLQIGEVLSNERITQESLFVTALIFFFVLPFWIAPFLDNDPYIHDAN